METHKSDGPMAAIAVIVAIALAFGLLFGLFAGWKTFSRYQSRADRTQNRSQSKLDANNQVTLNNIKIGFFKQQLQIAQQQANIRKANAVGIREAQDEISATLTPLYVQFEMVEALKQIATSGKNNTTVFIPSGDAGIPLIQGAGAAIGAK